VIAHKPETLGCVPQTKRDLWAVRTLRAVGTTGVATNGSSVHCRLLDDRRELEDAGRVIAEIWGEQATALASPELLRAYLHYGNPVLGAFDGPSLCGVSIGFLAPRDDIHLHSHITGVRSSHQRSGVGFALKLAQRDWCLANGIDVVTWTFDPMLSRNAYFNLRKLAGVADAFLPDFYGEMADALNRGERSDRLQVRWRVGSERVCRAVQSTPRNGESVDVERWVPIPEDYADLRRRDLAAACSARRATAERLEEAFAEGLVIADFDPTRGYGFVPSTVNAIEETT